MGDFEPKPGRIERQGENTVDWHPDTVRKTRNDLHATMDLINEIGILAAECLPQFIDAMEALCEKYPKMLERKGEENGLRRLKRLWAYARMAALQMNDLQKHYGFENTDKNIDFSFPVKPPPEDLKAMFRECMPPKDWLDL